ncbi:hypothetical protein ANCDUO_25521, partial [Ancylostoma duodenale]
KLGKLYISSCIEKDAKRLTINLKKADDLPRWSFLGAPGTVDFMLFSLLIIDFIDFCRQFLTAFLPWFFLAL